MGDGGSGFLSTMLGVFAGGEITAAVTAVISLLGQLVTAMGQVVTQGVQMAESLQTNFMNVEVGVNAAIRNGIDISMQQMNDLITQIGDKWKIFTQQDITQGAAILANNLTELGGNFDDVSKMMNIAAEAATMTGKSIASVVTILMQADVAGYSRTLNTTMLGLDFSTKKLDAEAKLLGYGDQTFAQLTVQERMYVTEGLLIADMADKQGDITNELTSQNNQQTAAQTKLSQMATVLGNSLAPAWTAIVQLVDNVASALVIALTFVVDIIDTIWTGLVLINDVLGGNFDKMKTDVDYIVNEWKSLFSGQVIQSDTMAPATPGTPSAADAAQATTDLATNEKTREKDAETYAQDMEDIETSLERNLEDDATNHAQKMEDIQTKNQQDIQDAATKFTNDMSDIDTNYNEKRETDYQKNADQIAKDESDLQVKLQELKEKALYDVSEDVRTGDASAARQVLRQYQFDKQQAIENGQKTSDDRQTAFQQELSDLDTQEAQEKAKREETYKQQLLDLQTQLAREKEAEDLAYSRKVADDQLKATRDRADKLTKYNQDLADLAAEENAEVAVVQKANDAKMASDDAVTANKAANLQQQAQMAGASSGKLYSSGPPAQIADLLRAEGYARGGSFIANSPTAAIFGEGGQPERVTITPLSVGRSNLTATGDGAGGAGGKLALEILLSENLIANIVENTLGEVSTAIETARRVS
jgi:hypothetical protein